MLCDGSDPVDDSRVLLFRFNSSGELNPKTTHKLRDSGGGKTLEIRQKCVQTELPTIMPSSHCTLDPDTFHFALAFEAAVNQVAKIINDLQRKSEELCTFNYFIAYGI